MNPTETNEKYKVDQKSWRVEFKLLFPKKWSEAYQNVITPFLLVWKIMFVSKRYLQFKMHSPGYFFAQITWANKTDVKGISQMSFKVQERTAEILEAEIIVRGCWQGSKLRVAYSFAGVAHFQKGREHWK